MKKLNLFSALFGFFFLTSALAGTPPPGTINIPSLVEKVDRGVVNIQSTTIIRQRLNNYGPAFEEFFRFYGIPSERSQKQRSLGSGFVIDKEGYILTNHHVIENASEIDVFFLDEKKKIRAKVIGSDKKTDLALLKVNPGSYLFPLALGDSDKSRVGESVVAIGNPFGLSHTVTAGIVSAKNRSIGQGPFDNFIQTDASINFGNSGGPLFNAEGEVIGINSAINAAGQGLGFAIPINQAKKLLPEIKAHGRVRRGWLGALVFTTPDGLVVDAVVLRGPAAKAGIRTGDIITSIGSANIQERFDADKALDSAKPGDTVTVKVEREDQYGSKTKKFEVKLSDEPNQQDLPQGLL